MEQRFQHESSSRANKKITWLDLGDGQLPDLREDVLFETMEDIAGGLGYHSSRNFDLAERVGFAHVPQAAAALASAGLRIPHE